MESYPETLKTRLHDEAYEYRRDAFLAFLKSPVRDYKESPTVKDYVEITDTELQEMLYGEMKESAEALEFSESANIKINNEEITVSDELLKQGVTVTTMVDALKTQPELVKKYVFPKLGKERIEYLINSAWRNGLFINIPDNAKVSVRAHTIASCRGFLEPINWEMFSLDFSKRFVASSLSRYMPRRTLLFQFV